VVITCLRVRRLRAWGPAGRFAQAAAGSRAGGEEGVGGGMGVARMCGIVQLGGGQGGRGARCKETRARDGLGQTDRVGSRNVDAEQQQVISLISPHGPS
jgi:hypothetical protein